MFKKLLFVIGSVAASITGFSQVFLESSPVGTSTEGALIVYGSSTLNNNRVPYDKINGSPFWKPDYRLASLVDASDKLMATLPVKINLYSNEVYFKNAKGEERVASNGRIKKVIFHSPDSSKKEYIVFDNSLPIIIESNPKAESPSFVMVLNDGGLQLLKHIRINLIVEDSLLGTQKRYKFSTQSKYYLHNKFGQASKLKKLNRENVLENINVSDELEAWMKENKIDFKDEQSTIKFLNYYNSRQ